MLTMRDNMQYITNRWYEIGISKTTSRVYGVFESVESAANKIFELETEQEKNSNHKDRFFIIEIQTMIVKDANGDIIFNNRIERKI